MQANLTENLERFQKIVSESRHLVFFGGAGVSTESGIPDFRSADGLYNQTYKYPPETILSHSFFVKYPKEFYEFYRDKMIYPDVKPNVTHEVLAKLEAKNVLDAVITQNIDGLHQLAGSKHVIELHGSILRNHCTKCRRFYSLDELCARIGFAPEPVRIPYCDCGGIIKPDVVLYEESLNDSDIHETLRLIQNADTLIIGGTSLTVYPAASFVQYFQGAHLILINRSATPYDKKADLLLQTGLGDVFQSLL